MEIEKLIDSTLLRPEATEREIVRLCEEAREYGFASVCTNSCYAETVRHVLTGSGVKTCVVVGFPLGAASTEAKVYEARYALRAGAEEIDMVMNIGALKGADPQRVEDDIGVVVEECAGKALVKVILECCLLDDNEKVEACEIAVAAGADFVKTSTGFGSGGATEHDVKLMKEAVTGHARVKASGGIRDLATAMEMIEAGADRLGTSNGAAIVDEARRG
ncbi:MAG: deoxyribose-phosphate aldolase [Candidatus Geothermincolia bacterium]